MTPPLLTNVHPADELSAVREEIKILEGRADELRAALLQEGADLEGDSYVAQIITNKRETLDRQQLQQLLDSPKQKSA